MIRSPKTLAVLNTLFFLLHLIPSQLTQTRVFNDQTIGDVSDKYPALFTPAGITFSIWGVIYVALLAFCVYHLVKSFKEAMEHEANADLQRIGFLFMLNNLATGAWTIAWVYEWLLLSVLLIFLQLATLLTIHLRIGIYNAGRSGASRWLTQVPLSLYFGWIIIATVANVSSALVGLGWNGFTLSPSLWTMIMIAVATGIVLFVVYTRTNIAVGLVGIWAFYGIIVKHQTLSLPDSPQIIATAWVGIGLIGVLVATVLFRISKKPTQLAQ
ncbi:hypothetical protein [Nibribacter koreensis]|uniref:Lantibiotic ABC transporter permease n=1 Tax=Nibribacter koreensis TaxID=1084519 RepID=A0ABP8F674_9BACT